MHPRRRAPGWTFIELLVVLAVVAVLLGLMLSIRASARRRAALEALRHTPESLETVIVAPPTSADGSERRRVQGAHRRRPARRPVAAKVEPLTPLAPAVPQGPLAPGASDAGTDADGLAPGVAPDDLMNGDALRLVPPSIDEVVADPDGSGDEVPFYLIPGMVDEPEETDGGPQSP